MKSFARKIALTALPFLVWFTGPSEAQVAVQSVASVGFTVSDKIEFLPGDLLITANY